jgi:hypothetical protein
MRGPDIIDKVGAAVLKDLTDRNGFLEVWDATDEDLKHELRRAIGTEALKALRNPDFRQLVMALKRTTERAVDSDLFGTRERSPIDIETARIFWNAMLDSALEPPPGCTCRLLRRTDSEPPEDLLDKHCLIHGWWVPEPDPDDGPDEDAGCDPAG